MDTALFLTILFIGLATLVLSFSIYIIEEVFKLGDFWSSTFSVLGGMLTFTGFATTVGYYFYKWFSPYL